MTTLNATPIAKAQHVKECQLTVINSIPGLYLLQLKDANGKVYASRLVTSKG